MSRVRIPPTLREDTGGEREVNAQGRTVGDLLDDLTSRFPRLEGKLEFANVYVEGEDVRTLDGLDTTVSDDTTVILLPAMARWFWRHHTGRTQAPFVVPTHRNPVRSCSSDRISRLPRPLSCP